jgi:hypothetical protein
MVIQSTFCCKIILKVLIRSTHAEEMQPASYGDVNLHLHSTQNYP